MALRQGVTSPVLMGACSQMDTLCNATAQRLGPASIGSGRGAGEISCGVSQYGLAVAKGRSGAVAEWRSVSAPVIESLSSAPTCSWDTRMDFRMSRANQIAAVRKPACRRRFPSAYQLFCIQVENSFMASPWTGTRLIYCTVLAEGTGGKARKRAGGFTGPAVYVPTDANSGTKKVKGPGCRTGTARHRGMFNQIETTDSCRLKLPTTFSCKRA